VKLYEYAAPTSLPEALDALRQAQGEVRPLAGGTDLIAQLKEGRRQLELVLDVKRIAECTTLRLDGRGLRIGAAGPCTAITESVDVRTRWPMLAEACRLVGSVQIQNRASVGGNLCNAAPSADTIPALICYGAAALIAGPRGRREVPVERFCTGPGKTVLERDELLLEIVLPIPQRGSAGHYQRFIPRAEMDIAVAGVGSYVYLDPQTRNVAEAVIALAAVAPTPVRASAAERALAGKPLSRESIAQAAEQAVSATRPINDVRGTIEYRQELVRVLTRRTLAQCAQTLGITL
jgi:carbon-monoxide dehydrogenase medium subunit